MVLCYLSALSGTIGNAAGIFFMCLSDAMFSKIPDAIRQTTSELPPWLIKGRVSPLVGIIETAVEMLIKA